MKYTCATNRFENITLPHVRRTNEHINPPAPLNLLMADAFEIGDFDVLQEVAHGG